MGIFYHITEQKDLGQILSGGLQPAIGPRASKTGQCRPQVYLCKGKDVHIWRLALPLENPRLLRVEPGSSMAQGQTEIRRYGRFAKYEEYAYSATIPPSALTPCAWPKMPENMQAIACDALLNLSNSIVAAVRICDRYGAYEGRQEAIRQDMEAHYEYEWEQAVRYCRRLDAQGILAAAGREALQGILESEGLDGEYTLCDTYGELGRPLWEQVAMMAAPLGKARQELSACAIECFPWVESVFTGGYENPYKTYL